MDDKPKQLGADDKGTDYRETLQGQFVMVPCGLLLSPQDGELTFRDVYVYLCLLAKQGAKDRLWWSVDSLVKLTGISATGIKESIQRLKKSGHVKRQRRMDGPTHTFCLTFVGRDKDIFIKGQKLVRQSDKPKSPVVRISPVASFDLVPAPVRNEYSRHESPFEPRDLEEADYEAVA